MVMWHMMRIADWKCQPPFPESVLLACQAFHGAKHQRAVEKKTIAMVGALVGYRMKTYYNGITDSCNYSHGEAR